LGRSEAGGAPIVDETLAIVAYAEVRAIRLAWAGIRTWSPAIRARAAVAAAIRGGGTSDLVARAQKLLRAESTALLDTQIGRCGPWPYDHALGGGQLGSVVGLEELFHDAARQAAVHRRDDRRLLSLAVGLADFVRNSAGGASTGPRNG